jgi:hypothetical protein
VGQLKPTVEFGISRWSPDGDVESPTVLPLAVGMRYLLHVSWAVSFWIGPTVEVGFVINGVGAHHVGIRGGGGLELRLGRVVLGVESGYTQSSGDFSGVAVAAKLGWSLGQMGRTGAPRSD